jgi:quinohemoprotein ethanol dehydrogenase
VKRKAFLCLLAAVAMSIFAYSASKALAQTHARAARAYGQINLKRLMSADQHPDQWLTSGRDFGRSYYSPLNQINQSNVSRLGFAWEYKTHTVRGLEATPIEVDGVMYTSGPIGQVYALDARTGKGIWTFDPTNILRVNQHTCCDEDNRGVAVWEGKVYVASLDGYLWALDARTGHVIWKVDTIVDHKRGYSSTGAPEVAHHVVIIGNAGSEFDARGYVSAYYLNTGMLAWRFYTVPGPPGKPYEEPELKKAAKTWDPHSDWKMGGGGTVWDAIQYDPELNLVYFGTGNGTFYNRAQRSPSGGDNLYISSLIALNPDTGRMAWYYQEVPGDQWDFDVVQPLILTNLKINGAVHKVIMQAPKPGFFLIIDRKTGKVLSANPYVPVTWAKYVDLKTGRPVETADARDFKYSMDGKRYIEPSPMGGHNWDPMSWDPETGLVYIPAIENGQTTLFSGKTFLRAWDPIRGKAVWNVPLTDWWDHAGVMSTAGGLVFQGTGDGYFDAYNAKTGQKLKSIFTGTTIVAAPMTYEIDGVQYVAVMAAWGGGGWNFAHPNSAVYQRGNEGRILAFKLGGGSTPVPPLLPPLGPFPKPPAQTGTAQTIKEGQQLFSSHCASCHLNMDRSLAPDLRRLTPEQHAAFLQIVRGGVLQAAGMPPWNDVLTVQQAQAIHDYVISLDWQAYNSQQTQQKK